jgi:uncharacterized protein YlxP (DUF503 family)
MIYIASAKFRVNVTWANSIKDRRQVAQKVRDWIKSKYNVSVKLIYEDHMRLFELYICLVSDDVDYSHAVIDEIQAWLDEDASLDVSCEYDVDSWK